MHSREEVYSELPSSLCLSPCAESKAPELKYLEKSSCKVSGISSSGFPSVELNFSFSLSTNSLNSFAQTFENKRQKCYQPQFLRVGKDLLLLKCSWKILVEITGFELPSQKQYNRQENASKKLCGGCVC